MEIKRILQIITLTELGGAQSVVINLANKLSEKYEVIVAAGDGDGKMWDLLNPKVKREQCTHLQRSISPLKDIFTLFDFLKLYRKYKPDIIHLHSSKAGILGRLSFPSCKIIYTVHGFDSIRLAHRKFLPIEKIMQKACKAIVGVSHYDEINLKNEGISNNVHCIYNGISTTKENASIDLSIPSIYKKKVLCIARLAAPKRVDIFIKVAQLLPQYAFIWIGNQNEVTNKPQNAFFLGNIPNASIYNSIADLFMLASDYEGLPMVILEAMCYGKPIVASNVGGIKEIVRENINGYVVNNNAEEFKVKISEILENQNVYDQFSTNSKSIFEKELTVDSMVNSYLEIYKSE